MDVNINAGLIEPCFEALLEVATPDSDLYYELELISRRTGPLAIQKRGGKIIESFPWPISKELTHLFSSSYNIRDQNRLLKIFRVAERISQFLSFCWLVQLWDAKNLDPSIKLSADLITQCASLKKPTIGTFLGIIRASSTIMFEEELPIFFKDKDIKERTGHLIQEIEKLTVSRNKEIHFKEELTCHYVEEILANIMVQAAFLVKYPLVSVKKIQVSKPKLSKVSYGHEFDYLNSQRSEFIGGYIELDSYSESYSVLLLENLQSMGSYLNLSPFVINTEPLLESRGSSQVMHGLYMYLENDKNKIQYSFVNETDIQELSNMPEADIFGRQWDNFFEVLSV